MRSTSLLASASIALLACLACDRGDEAQAAQALAAPPRERAAAAPRAGDGEAAVSAEEAARLGEGFVVWESRRGGAWRIWRRDLDGGGLRQLSPEETGRDHCCAHVSPDGEHVVYLSLP